MATASVDLRRIAGALGEIPRRAMEEAARAVEEIAEQEGRPPFRKRSRAIKLRATSEFGQQGDKVQCRVQGVPVGLWVIRSSGAGPHRIPKGGRKTTLAGGLSHPIRTPPPIRHPGSSGNNAWQRVQARAAKVVPKIFAEAVHEVVR